MLNSLTASVLTVMWNTPLVASPCVLRPNAKITYSVSAWRLETEKSRRSPTLSCDFARYSSRDSPLLMADSAAVSSGRVLFYVKTYYTVNVSGDACNPSAVFRDFGSD